MQLYAAVSGAQDAMVVHGYARAVAEELEKARPKLVTSRMTKALRPGKVLVDWSQNHPAKTTIAPYSLRGRALPHAAAPRTWDELDEHLTQLDHDEVVARLQEDGDLLEPLAHRGPEVPAG
jgi:bifunctional non-homologous end joining protein LigD